jgi:hypothetical protein
LAPRKIRSKEKSAERALRYLEAFLEVDAA